MKGLLLFLLVVTTFAAPMPKPGKRPMSGTGWRGKLSKWLPGPLARRLAFNTATGYDTGKCLASFGQCPAAKNAVCGPVSAKTLCSNANPVEATMKSELEQLYTWAATEATKTAADTVFDIPAGLAWNKWPETSGCGSQASCANIYTKALLLYDESNCWPKSKAVPIIVNARDGKTDEQLKFCAKTVKHLLGKKPLGAFLRSPVEQLEYVIKAKVMITCGNAAMSAGSIDKTKLQYPYLQGEGGGGTAGSPRAYAEHTGMCGAWNTDLKAVWKKGGTRFGGAVTTEEFGHTFYDTAIAQYDPEGWHAVQKAEAAANALFVSDSSKGHQRDPDWDCHTAATEYFAAGVDMLLYNTRIGENHKATTRTEMKTQDPSLWCLALRHYELNNKFTPCNVGPPIADVTQDVDCKATLKLLGVTIFGPDGSNGVKGGGAKTDASLTTSSKAFCPADPSSCSAYAPTITKVTGVISMSVTLAGGEKSADYVKDTKVINGVERGIAKKLGDPCEASWVKATLTVDSGSRRLSDSVAKINVAFTVTIPSAQSSKAADFESAIKGSTTAAEKAAWGQKLGDEITATTGKTATVAVTGVAPTVASTAAPVTSTTGAPEANTVTSTSVDSTSGAMSVKGAVGLAAIVGIIVAVPSLA